MSFRKVIKKIQFYNPVLAFAEFLILNNWLKKNKSTLVLLTLRAHQNLSLTDNFSVKVIKYRYKLTQLYFLLYKPDKIIFEDLDTRLSFLKMLYSMRVKYLFLNNDFFEYIQYFGIRNMTPRLELLFLFCDSFEAKAIQSLFGISVKQLSHKIPAKSVPLDNVTMPRDLIFVGEVMPNRYLSKINKNILYILDQIKVPVNHKKLYSDCLPKLLDLVAQEKISILNYFQIKYYLVTLVRENTLVRLHSKVSVEFYGVSDSNRLPKFEKAQMSSFRNKTIIDPGCKSYSAQLYERVISALNNDNTVLSVVGDTPIVIYRI